MASTYQLLSCLPILLEPIKTLDLKIFLLQVSAVNCSKRSCENFYFWTLFLFFQHYYKCCYSLLNEQFDMYRFHYLRLSFEDFYSAQITVNNSIFILSQHTSGAILSVINCLVQKGRCISSLSISLSLEFHFIWICDHCWDWVKRKCVWLNNN